MAGQGRKPKPTALKVLDGNPGRRPINEKEPKPKKVNKLPAPPRYFGKYGKSAWNKYGAILIKMGLLSKADMIAFEALCHSYELYYKASSQLNRLDPDDTATGILIKGDNGIFYPNPLMNIARQQLEMFRKLLVEFGMTPSSRSRLQVEGEDTPEEWLEGLLQDVV